MLKKLGVLCDALMLAVITAQSKTREIKREIREDEHAMEVIQVVMIIAVGVIAIAAIWAGVNGLLKYWWDAILGHGGTQELDSIGTTPTGTTP